MALKQARNALKTDLSLLRYFNKADEQITDPLKRRVYGFTQTFEIEYAQI